MRRSLAVLSVLGLVLMACEDTPPPETPKPIASAAPPPIETAKVEVAPPTPPKKTLAEMQKVDLQDALDGLNGHDAKKFASVYSDKAVISVAGLNEVDGRAGVESNMNEWFDTFKNAKLGFSRVWTKGDTMVLEWVINGTHHGELFGVKGTEQPIGHYGLSIVTFDPDGRVLRDRYGDLGTVMTQVGAGGKAKPRPIPEVPKTPDTIVSGAAGEDKNVEIAKNTLAALEAGKKEADFTNLLTDDIQSDGLFHLETTKGKDESKKFFKSFTTAFPDAKFDVSRAIGIGDYAIVESVLHATQKGQLGSIAPTKKPVAIHLVDVFQIKDGKVSRAWTYQNSLEMQQQLGLFEVKSGSIPASQATPAAPAPTTAPAPKK